VIELARTSSETNSDIQHRLNPIKFATRQFSEGDVAVVDFRCDE